MFQVNDVVLTLQATPKNYVDDVKPYSVKEVYGRLGLVMSSIRGEPNLCSVRIDYYHYVAMYEFELFRVGKL